MASLEELKKRLERAQDVIVVDNGKLISPADSEASEATDQEEEAEIPERTQLKPTRWYAVL
ncbi:MAG: hypothetical protein H8E40_13950 [Chloroflexi bacterium]|nr:hypothetical protein [Chloroflexota bacterium]